MEELVNQIREMLSPLDNAMNLVAFSPTGSRFMCDPPVMDTDIDFVALVVDHDAASEVLTANGWTKCVGENSDEEDSSYDELGEFSAYRKDNFNLIICDDRAYYVKYCAATLLCTKLNLLDKAERCDLFQTIVKGESYVGRVA